MQNHDASEEIQSKVDIYVTVKMIKMSQVLS